MDTPPSAKRALNSFFLKRKPRQVAACFSTSPEDWFPSPWDPHLQRQEDIGHTFRKTSH
jgi:hypothetical protein